MPPGARLHEISPSFDIAQAHSLSYFIEDLKTRGVPTPNNVVENYLSLTTNQILSISKEGYSDIDVELNWPGTVLPFSEALEARL